MGCHHAKLRPPERGEPHGQETFVGGYEGRNVLFVDGLLRHRSQQKRAERNGQSAGKRSLQIVAARQDETHVRQVRAQQAQSASGSQRSVVQKPD